jgi:hypothetical protein
MASITDIFKPESKAPLPVQNEDGNTKGTPSVEPLVPFSDAELLELHRKCKLEAFAQRTVFERQWTRNIWYVLGRQWIEYNQRDGTWKDKRLAKWIPRPVTNKCKETVQSIRAMFASIQLGMSCRPNGSDPKNISVAATCDELAPLLHQNYNMDAVMSEFDWWLIVTGNAFLYTYWDYDVRHGMLNVPVVECLDCGSRVTEDKLDPKQPGCPDCGSPESPMPAVDEMGEPVIQRMPRGKGVTDPLSPLELAFPNSYPRFTEVPYVYRMRWRSKSYFESHPKLKLLVSTISWSKSPDDRSLQIFKAMTTQNDLGVNPSYLGDGGGTGDTEEGVTEYELWHKPCDAYPDGLVVRIIGEKSPLILHLEEDEAVPGPLPYTDADGMPVFPFAHGVYDHVGGRVLGSGVIDIIVQKQDQLNQLDSMIQMIIQRMANPIWLEPKGAEVEKFTGEPGLVVKWNPLTVQGNAKPERIAGEGPHGSLFQIREQYLKDIEELAGTFDIVKGAKPTGVEAFSALQLLVERSQSRFSSVFGSRADAAGHTLKVQLELERSFGPNTITKAVLSPAKTWSFENFQRADLQGNVSVVVESGSQAPKTNLGKRAAIEHLNQLGMIDPQDPDQKYKIFQEFGMAGLSPSLDIHVTSALQKQQAFEEWIQDEAAVQQWAQAAQQKAQMFEAAQAEVAQTAAAMPPDPVTGMPAQAPAITPPSPLEGTPLVWRQWYNAVIHEQEFMKWANGDVIRQLVQEKPEVVGLLEGHLMEMRIARMELEAGVIGGQTLTPEPAQPAGAGKPGAGNPKDKGSAMGNSNKESTQGNEPRGNGEGAQNAGPR